MIRFGIIGCGNISSTHADAINSLENAELTACCDINKEKGETFAAKNHCRFYPDFQELLLAEDIDVVTIATPHYLHKEVSIAALQARKHVICEKPMATNTADAKEIIQVAKNSKKLYTVCFQNRFNASTVELKKMLSQKKFGKLKGIKSEITWHRNEAYYAEADWKGRRATEGGGVLINQAIHMLDEVCWLIEKPQKIKGMVLTSLLEGIIEVEDAAMATAVMPNGVPWVIHTSNNYSQDPSPSITFDFETASVRLTTEALFVDNELIFLQNFDENANGKVYWGSGHRTLFKTFMNKLLGKRDPLTDYLADTDALESLQVVCGIYASSELNQWIELT